LSRRTRIWRRNSSNIELEVLCLPEHIPAVILVDPEPLRSGRAILVQDLELPEEVKTTLPPEEVVATLLHVAVEPVAEEEDATA
jgi:hypothetical protein